MPADSGFAVAGDYQLTCVVQSEADITTQVKWYKSSTPMGAEKVQCANILFTRQLSPGQQLPRIASMICLKFPLTPSLPLQYSTSSNTDKTVYTSLLYFTATTTADAGSYTCRAEYIIAAKTTTINSDPADVYVRGTGYNC